MKRPRRLAWPRTAGFQSVNWGSNPHGVIRVKLKINKFWRCARVVEWAAFEKRYSRKVIRGSNPLTSVFKNKNVQKRENFVVKYGKIS